MPNWSNIITTLPRTLMCNEPTHISSSNLQFVKNEDHLCEAKVLLDPNSQHHLRVL